MDDKLSNSLIAFGNVIDRIDKSKLKEIVAKIDKLEPNVNSASIVNYTNDFQGQFVFFYDLTHEKIEGNNTFNEENTIENTISTMFYKHLDNTPKFNVCLDGIIIENTLEAGYSKEVNEALAA